MGVALDIPRRPGNQPIHDRYAIVNTVCDRIARGELVKDVCAELQIDPAQIRQWTAVDETLATLYTRARIDQAHAFAEQAISIADGADDETQGRIEAMASAVANVDKDFEKDRILNALAAAAVQRDRIRVDARKWMASKLAPKLYGERQQVDVDVTITLDVLVAQSRRIG